MKYDRLHPYTILINLKKLQGFLAVPILYQILWMIFGQYGLTRNPFIFNIFLIVAIVSYAFIRYFSIGLKCDDLFISLKKGIINKREINLPYDDINFLISERNIVQLLFNCKRLEFYSVVNDKIFRDKIYVKDISIKKILSNSKYGDINNIIHKSKLLSTFFVIMSWSNFITVSLVIVPIINQSTKILGEEISNKIYSRIDMEKYFIAVGIPPMIAKVAYLSILIILLFLILQTIRYGNFKLISENEFFYTRSGIVYRNEQWIKKSSINAISQNQMFITKLLGISSLYFHCIGKQRKKSEKNLLALSCSNTEIKDILNKIGYTDDYKYELKSPNRCLKNFINVPLIFLVISFLISMMFLFYKSTKILGVIFLGLSLYLIYWIIFRIMAYKNTSISYGNNILKISGYKNMSLINGYIFKKNIVKISVRRNIFQKFSNRCDLKIYIKSSYGENFTAKNLDYEEAIKFSKNINSMNA